MVENVNVALIHHSQPTWAELCTRTFNCSFEEDLAAPAGEDSIVTTWSLIRANHADFTPTLSLHSWRRSDTFLSVGGTGERGGGKIQTEIKNITYSILFKNILKSSRGIEIYLLSFLTCAFMSSKSSKALVTIWALKDKMICNLWSLPKSSGCHDSTFFLWTASVSASCTFCIRPLGGVEHYRSGASQVNASFLTQWSQKLPHPHGEDTEQQKWNQVCVCLLVYLDLCQSNVHVYIYIKALITAKVLLHVYAPLQPPASDTSPR